METDKGETHAFVHALIPASLVESLRPKKLRRMHRRAAAAFEQQNPDNFEALAYHNLRAGLEKQGVEYLLLAGDRARGLFAHQEAIASYKKAVDLLVEMGDFEKTARTLMKLGLTYHNAFEFEESRRAYEHGFIAWQRAGESSDLTTLAPKPLKAVYLNPATLDSSRCIDDGSSEMIFQLFSGLVELSPNLSVLPDVAHSWEVQEGGRKYIFRLRDNVYWSDGVQVTAGDFEYAWRRVLDPSSNPWSAGLLSVVKGAQSFYNGELSDPNQVGVHALDELTLVVELEEPTSFFLQLLTYVIAFPIPQHLVEVEGEAWTEVSSIVTNGPFKLAAWDRGESAVFERNPGYHGRFFGNLERVEASFFTGEEQNLLDKYEKDNIDFLHLIHLLPAEADAARQQYAGEYITGPYLGESFVGFDVSRPPLDDRRVRRALNLATSREKLASIINRGLQFPATGGLLPPGMPGYSPNIALPYNPEEARMYLAKAGYPEGRGFPIMDCLAPDVPSVLTLIASLKDQWLENLGIVVNCRSMEWERFLEQLASPSSNMWFMGIQVDYPDPDYILRVVWSMTNAEYRWQNTTYEKLVNNALHLMDQEKRIELYQQADRILVEEAPILPLEYGRINILVKPWVKNLIYSPMNPPFWKDIVIELD
jgi:oligopeptide transport system substrate-binding protein